jgi:RNA polymerase sigma-70 factor, ECF subfamily
VTDAALVELSRTGETEAFGELVDRHRDAVFRAALAALRDPAEADDAAQDAFLLAWRRLWSFRGESSFRTWILTIAWRTALRRRRGVGRWLRRFVSQGAPGSEAFAPIDVRPTPEVEASQAEMGAHVRRLLGGLPARLRDPLLLVATGDHGYDEMASLLGVPAGTLKWRVSEARRLLKARLRALGYADE